MAYEAMITNKLPSILMKFQEEKYKEKLSYYQADMNFKLGIFKSDRFGTESNGQIYTFRKI
jgi:hypothetical protein